MDFHSWKVDLSAGSASHSTGFTITIEGSALCPEGVTPGKFPENMTAIDQATLLRCGLDAMVKAASGAKKSNKSTPPRRLMDDPDRTRPSRPILSLKR